MVSIVKANVDDVEREVAAAEKVQGAAPIKTMMKSLTSFVC